MLLSLLIMFLLLAIIAAVVAGLLLFALGTALLTVGGWLLATVAGIEITGMQEKREEILLASICVLLVATVATLIVVW